MQHYFYPPLRFAMNVCCSTIITVSPYPILDGMRHLLLRLICIIAGLYGQSPLHKTI
jgi:hypothetical protein